MVLGTCVQFWLPCTLGAGHDTLLQPWSQSVRQAVCTEKWNAHIPSCRAVMVLERVRGWAQSRIQCGCCGIDMTLSIVRTTASGLEGLLALTTRETLV